MSKQQSMDCFAHQKFMLRLTGLQINQNLGCKCKIYYVILFITITIYPILVIPEITKLCNEFNQFIYSLMSEIGYTTALFGMYCWIYNKKQIAKIFEQIQHLRKFANCIEGFQENPILRKYEHFIRKQSIFGIVFAALASLAIMSVSMFFSKNEKNWMLPFGSGPSINNKMLQFLSQIVIYEIVMNAYILIVFCFINILTILSCHCKILQNFIKNLLQNSLKNVKQDSRTKNKNTNLTDNIIPWKFIELELKKLVSYHVGIIELAAEIENAFCILTLILFVGVSMCLCMAMLQIMSDFIHDISFLKNVTIAFVSYLLMGLVAYRGEQVITESRNIAEACSEIDFVGADIRLQRSLLMILRQGQKPMLMTLGKMTVLSLSITVAVLQTCYSYYTLLRNIKN